MSDHRGSHPQVGVYNRQNHAHWFPRRRRRKEGQQRNQHRGVLARPPRRRGRTTPGRGNLAPSGIDASPSGGWLSSPPALTQGAHVAVDAELRSHEYRREVVVAVDQRPEDRDLPCDSGKSASTPSSNSTAPPSANRLPTATRRRPAEGHLLTTIDSSLHKTKIRCLDCLLRYRRSEAFHRR